MNSKLAGIINTNGLDHEVFEDIKDRIHKENLFNQGTFVLVINVFLMLILGTHIRFDEWTRGVWLYEAVGVIIISLQQIAYRTEWKSRALTMLLCYASMEHVLVGTILIYYLIPTFHDMPSMIFMCGIVAMPLSVVDRIWRMGSFIVWNELLFLYVSYSYQTAELFRINSNNSYLFVIVAIFLYINIVMRTMQHMSDKMFIEMERDTDELTRVLNRKAANTLVNRLLDGDHIGVAFMIDVDYFKHFNDSYGHAYGDKVLQRVAAVLRGTFRRKDIVARYGGDEFIVYMPDATIDIAERRAGEIKERLLKVADPGREITLSIGIAEAIPSDTSLSTILKRADEAVYIVKERGRNGFATYTQN